jgi:hypothetical protein
VTPWRPVNLASAVDAFVLEDGTARTGTQFLRANTTEAGGSVAIDTAEITGEGALPLNVYVLAWVRAPQRPIDGTLTLWELSPDVDVAHSDRPFGDLPDEWIMIENALDVVAANSVTFRVEFYIGTTGEWLDIDTVMCFS